MKKKELVLNVPKYGLKSDPPQFPLNSERIPALLLSSAGLLVVKDITINKNQTK